MDGQTAVQRMKDMNARVQTEGRPRQGEVSYVQLDLTDLESVKSGADAALKLSAVMDYVILNAGVSGTQYTKTKHNLELQIGVFRVEGGNLARQVLKCLLQCIKRFWIAAIVPPRGVDRVEVNCKRCTAA